ncbi:uncharacterized protein DDB_G0271670 [Anopheles aquasalis]|uniref:uncharacterized protein DDB_G0271670 n=1 Tax=Anopheles aquasalis TaxID=42839 RepID=UPI00215AF450|nr:uncharacterized protein DDB_G0271670 [Anopheles aquasalis]
MKCEMEPGCKKGPKAGKDSRINIKIFLGQTVQQDSSDTGISDTEAPTPATTTTTTTSTATAAASLQKSDSTPAMSSTSSTTMTMPTEPYSTFTTGSGSKGIKAAIQASSTSSSSQSSNSGGNTGAVGSGTTTGTTSGRSSSLAQRRAQFQANRQNSEAHDRRHPPLVRAMSAPIRPADPDTSKFLQSKKKPRRRKVLREKDEYNICEEDEYSDEGGNILCSSGSSSSCNGTGGGALSTNGAGTVKGSASIGNGGLPLRSRSVLGGACDIETLVSLLSSGGSDSEKEQEQQNSTQNTVPPNGPASGHGAGSGVASPASFRQPFTSAHLKGRAPMLKKTGKSVSFQESDLKPPVANAGLNRDYRKPTFQPTVANRVRRAVHTLNAFQLKDREKSDEKEPNEEKWASDWLTREKDPGQSPQDSSPSAEHPTKQGAAGAGGGKTTETTGKSSSAAIAGTNGDLLQSPKEQECYRLYLKMSKKGLAVSYDTILRGMLTPTELRVLQKKKSRCQRADDGDGAKDENLIGSEDDMLSPGENGPLSPIAITEPSLKEHELSLPLPCQTATSAGGLGILTIPEEPSVIEHEITASGDSDVS